MKRLVLAAVLGITVFTAFANGNSKKDNDPLLAMFKMEFLEITDYMYDGNFQLALPRLLKWDTLRPGNHNIKYQIGYCYLFSSHDQDKAVSYLEDASENVSVKYEAGYWKEQRAPLDAYKLLADAYHVNYKFGQAIETYEKYKENFDEADAPDLFKEINRMVEMCRNGMEIISTPVDLTITNLGPTINSRYPDYRPIISVDESTLIFTSRRTGSTGNERAADGKFFEDIYIAYKNDTGWTKPVGISQNINTDDHEATVGLTADGSKLLIYEFKDGSGDLFESTQDSTGWKVPSKIGSDVNTESWETHASISADGNLLFFTSDREGGLGGRDIYYCGKAPDGSWGMAMPVGTAINTEYDEESPYFHPNGRTLFFSSKGHNSIGGFDIFYVDRNDDGTWTEPTNMGYPLNTTGDDVFFQPTVDYKKAYYSSFHKEGYGDQDIYLLEFPSIESKPITVYSGYVKNKAGNVPDDVFIQVFDNETGEQVGGETRVNPRTGKYIIMLEPGRDYEITYDIEGGCYFHTEIVHVSDSSAYQVKNDVVELNALNVGSVVEIENIFFDYGKSTLKKESEASLNKVFTLMKRCTHIKYELAGHTDSHGNDKYNQDLSQARCESVVKYLVKMGIEAERITAKGYGESEPVAPNENEDGTDNPEGRAKNRRIELRVVEF